MKNKILPMHKIILAFLLMLNVWSATAQVRNITGTVRDAVSNETIPGVTVAIKGTTKGTITDINGKFQIEAVNSGDSLLISYIGYKKEVVKIGKQVELNIQMYAEAALLDEVVITALGIKREKKTIGYAMQEIKAKEIEAIKSVNFSSELAGKVAGLKITTTNGGPGSSTDIILRGLSSLSSNQALIVVDGVPFTNNTVNNSNEWGGVDYGNGLSDLNPEDIEGISVLKGASASALYGSKALNGVIMVTTKRGKSRKGIGVTITNSYSFDVPYFHYEMQNVYGAGRSGKFIACWDTNNGVIAYDPKSASAYGSWGLLWKGKTLLIGMANIASLTYSLIIIKKFIKPDLPQQIQLP